MIENDSYYITHYTVNNFYSQVHDHTFFLLILNPAHNTPKSKDALGVQEVGGTKQTSSSYGNVDSSSETNQTSPKGTRKSEDCVDNQYSTSTQEETSENNVKRRTKEQAARKTSIERKPHYEKNGTKKWTSTWFDLKFNYIFPFSMFILINIEV